MRLGLTGFIALVAILIIGVAVYLGCAAANSPPASPSNTGPAAADRGVTLDIVAHNFAFNTQMITVPAGYRVTVNFDNQDAGAPHNFAVYQNLQGGQASPVFIGDTITGPAKTTYHFTAPATRGNYFFECDVHPDKMNGIFEVKVPSQ